MYILNILIPTVTDRSKKYSLLEYSVESCRTSANWDLSLRTSLFTQLIRKNDNMLK